MALATCFNDQKPNLACIIHEHTFRLPHAFFFTFFFSSSKRLDVFVSPFIAIYLLSGDFRRMSCVVHGNYRTTEATDTLIQFSEQVSPFFVPVNCEPCK